MLFLQPRIHMIILNSLVIAYSCFSTFSITFLLCVAFPEKPPLTSYERRHCPAVTALGHGQRATHPHPASVMTLPPSPDQSSLSTEVLYPHYQEGEPAQADEKTRIARVHLPSTTQVSNGKTIRQLSKFLNGIICCICE